MTGKNELERDHDMRMQTARLRYSLAMLIGTGLAFGIGFAALLNHADESRLDVWKVRAGSCELAIEKIAEPAP